MKICGIQYEQISKKSSWKISVKKKLSMDFKLFFLPRKSDVLIPFSHKLCDGPFTFWETFNNN